MTMKYELASVREALDRVIRDRKDQPHVHGDTMVGCLTYADLRDLMLIRASLSKIEEGMGWIPVSERLPELHQMVALVHIIDRWWATGRDEAVNRYDAGYLNEFGEKYWAIRGHRASAINSYTHWMPLPTPPDTHQP